LSTSTTTILLLARCSGNALAYTSSACRLGLFGGKNANWRSWATCSHGGAANPVATKMTIHTARSGAQARQNRRPGARKIMASLICRRQIADFDLRSQIANHPLRFSMTQQIGRIVSPGLCHDPVEVIGNLAEAREAEEC